MPVNKRQLTERDFANASVFRACEDGYRSGAKIDEKVLLRSPYHRLFSKSNKRRLVLDPSVPDFKELFVGDDAVVAADEVLEAIKPSALKVPLKARSDFSEADALPSSDLLKAIHYYARTEDIVHSSFDETALLALGVLADKWAESVAESTDPSMFMDAPENACSFDSDESLSSISSDDEPPPPEAITVELSESDTASEIGHNTESSAADSDSSSTSSDSDSDSTSGSSD